MDGHLSRQAGEPARLAATDYRARHGAPSPAPPTPKLPVSEGTQAAFQDAQLSCQISEIFDQAANPDFPTSALSSGFDL